jgi:hypothetical protein
MRRHLGGPALASVILAALLLAPAAGATPFATTITSPANDTFFQFTNDSLPGGFAGPVTNSFTVSGTAPGMSDGTELDIVCSFGPGTGWNGDYGPADELLGTATVESGAFSANVAFITPGLDTCTLQAVAAGDYTDASGVLDPSAWSGPVIGVDDVDDGQLEHSNPGFDAPLDSDYLFTGTQLGGYMEWTSVSGCGLSLSFPYDSTYNWAGDSVTATEPLFQCAGALFPFDDGADNSDISIDGDPAFTALGAWEVYWYGAQSALPKDTVTETLDPSTGDLSITEVQPLVYCSHNGTSPDSPSIGSMASCSHLLQTGVTLTRTITQSQGGLQAEVSDQFTDSSGSARQLIVEYDDHIGGNGQDQLEGPTAPEADASPTSPGFSFNGAAYATYPESYEGSASGDLVTSFPSAPGTIGIEGEAPASIGGTVTDPQPGIDDPQGAITYMTAPSQALFSDPNETDAGDETPSNVAAEFELTYDRTIPASGSSTITQFYTQGLSQASVDSLAASASDTSATPSVAFTSPVAGATVTSQTITVSGTASDQFATPALTLNGAPVSVTAGGWSSQLTLTPGQNTLTAVATAAGQQAQAEETIDYSPGGVCIVPAVTGLAESAAESALTAAGCTIGTILKAASASVPAGDVISTTPAAETHEPGDYSVELVISTGPASNSVQIDSIKPGKGGVVTVVVTVPDHGTLDFLISGADGHATTSAYVHAGHGRFVYAQSSLAGGPGRVSVRLKPTKRGRALLAKASAAAPLGLLLYVGFRPDEGHAIAHPKAHPLSLR